MSDHFRRDREACQEWLLLACRLWMLKTRQERYEAACETRGGKASTLKASLAPAFGYVSCKSPPGKKEAFSASIPLPAARLDPGTLKRMAYVQGLEPILHDLIRRGILPGSDLPQDLPAEWERAYFANVVRNSALMETLGAVIRESRARKIPLIGLKGLASTASVYKDPGLRIMADIDILCRPKDLPALRRIVLAAGFHGNGYLQAHHLSYYHKDQGYPFECHFSLQYAVRNRKKIFQQLWERCRPDEFDGLSLSLLSFEDQLIFDLAHILDHVYRVPLKSYVDLIAWLIFFMDDIDWDCLEKALEQSRLDEEFAALCAALSGLFDMPLDLPIRSEPSQRHIDRVKKAVRDHLLTLGFDRIRRTASRIKSYASPCQKTGFTLKYLFPPLSVIQAAYGKKHPFTAALHYPLHLCAVFRGFRKRKKMDPP